ncbi:MAG: EAL domain-containing protein [Gammaproteobacteria bacterium]|nr:EAL domain-containing protein [Gammaproteobacteria bacterium]
MLPIARAARTLSGWRKRTIAAALAVLAAQGVAAQPAPERIIFGGDAEYPPFEWREGDFAVGFYVDLAQAVAASGGAASEHRLGDWPDAIRALESGRVDVVAMFESEGRAERFLFTPPFHFVNHGIYGRAGADSVSSLADLRGRVAVEELSYAHERIPQEGLAVELVLTGTTAGALRAVEAGRADYAVLAAPAARYLISERRMSLQELGSQFWPTGYVFAVRKDRPELAQWLDLNLRNVLRSGEYRRILGRWEPRLGPSAEPLRLQPVALGLLLTGLVALAAGWIRSALGRRADAGVARAAAGGDGATDERITWAQDHDVYTQLPRLHRFLERVDQLIASAAAEGGQPMQLLAIHPSDLELTIRTLGHRAGIDAVRGLAERLREMNFPACGQSGRDVFFVFGDKTQVDATLRKIVSPVDTLVVSADVGPLLVIGSARWPQDGEDASELLRRAETALSAAISRRESWIEYRPSMEPDSCDLELLKAFRERAAEGMYPVFQPQIDVRTGEVVGAETLARWDAPGIGPVSPQKFIPLLEEANLIRHVTSRMITETVRVAAELRRRGCPCPISVNVAVSDLLGDKTRQTIFKALRRHGGVPADLKLELTETSVSDSAETVRWVMTRLRESGIRVSIDDFGTGYSSLAYLSDFPIHEIKIDRSFVSGILDKPQNRSIVRSTIEMAHSLGLVVVAEGVESREALAVLREENCDRAQGFLLSRPLPEDEFVAFVEAAAGGAAAAGAGDA